VKLHKIGALGILIGMVIHIYGHVRHMKEISMGRPRHMVFDPHDEMAGMKVWEQVFVGRKTATPTSYGKRYFTIGAHRWAHLTGVLLTAYFGVMMLTATSCVRRFRSGVRNAKFTGYNLFRSIHQYWWIAYAVCFLHAPQVWIWWAWPFALVLLDRAISRPTRKSTVRLLEAQCLPRSVLRLQFELPESFAYTAGQYVTLKCDNLNEEWHPFTICSAPEEGFLELYIRSSDELDWCSALRKAIVPIKGYWRDGNKKPVKYEADAKPDWRYPKELLRNIPDLRGHEGADLKSVDRVDEKKMVVRVESSKLASLPETGDDDDDKRPIILRIDGPFGAPAEAVWTYKTVMLVGAGIGVTPFASILRSWCLKSEAMRKMGTRDPQPSRLYFYWVCRGIEEFYWFEDLLLQSLKGPGKTAFEFNLFATGECKYSEVSDSRLVKSLSGQTFFGRPNWKRIFGDVKTRHAGEHVGCFLCGPEAIRSQLVTSADMFSDDNTKFSVHAESF